ncbi:hypothetical protein F5Y14DRAFT_461644 [Nemania sp. NC0429]|nr:hypothetical protein F5Y14DRAFT_461644 [Nemania sp. NC0429]
MNMEPYRFPRRSASHGTLRSSYSSHGCPGAGPPPIRPLHKPLRSVNENSVLLHSPGALESMLKTTTETGDIGIFTIKPIPPSPLGPRGTASNVGHPHPRPRRSVDNLCRHSPAMRPPSHRDATSDVLSVYGSDSLKSGTSTLSPNSTEDLGPRSFSMTTCGSRHLSHHRSTNTLQSQASGGSYLQRPRSPFPYPTRLKRPGVRPASPAITENGQIDYSRMVEINRISHRTIHGHFKHAYSPMSRRPHPLGMRAGVDLSTPLLAPPGPPPNFHGPLHPSIRTNSPASTASWNSHFHERFENTSTRACSFTSAVNMYRRMPPAVRIGQILPTEPPPRYYDYTEDFENKPPRLASLAQELPPLHPSARYPQLLMLRGDDDHLTPGHLAAVFGEGDSAFYDGETQVTDEHDAFPGINPFPNQNRSHAEAPGSLAASRPGSVLSQSSSIDLETSESGSRNKRSRRDSIETFNPSLDIEAREAPPSYSYIKSPERHVQVLGGRALTIRSEQGVILREDTHFETTSRETPDSWQSHVEYEADGSHSPGQHSESPMNNECTSQELYDTHESSGQDEPRDTSQSPRCVDRQPFKPVLVSPESEESKPTSIPRAAACSYDAEEQDTGQNLDKSEPETTHNWQFRRHRRNHAALRISSTNLPRGDNEGHPHITPTCSTVPLMSPKPISPARQLKLKNSIPQLMKSLPPLPGVLGYDLPSATADVSEEDEFAEILVPFRFRNPETSLQQNQLNDIKPTSLIDGAVLNPQRDGLKFRLRIKTGCSETSRADEGKFLSERSSNKKTKAGEEIYEKKAQKTDRNKLKIRSPRRSRLSSSHSSTVRHNQGAGTSRIVTDLIRQKPHDLFSITPKSEAVVLRKRRKPLSQLAYPQTTTIAGSAGASNSIAPHGRNGSISYGMPSDISPGNNDLSDSNKDTRISSIPPHGLVKRLSKLRALLAASSTSAPRVPAIDSLRIHKVTAHVLAGTSLDNKDSVKTSDSSKTESTQLRLGQRIRARLSRWVRGAKTGMRKCANKKRNRNEREGEEKNTT